MNYSLFRLKALIRSLLILSWAVSAGQGYCGLVSQGTVLEAKAGYFVFADSTMRKVYDKGGPDIQLCASYPLWKLSRRWILDAYGAVEYFHLSGKAINGGQKSSLWSVPVNIGLKPVLTINKNMHYYFAMGPRYFYIHQHNCCPYTYKSNSRNGLGLFVNTGLEYVLNNHFLFDIFGEYSYAETHFRSRNSRVYTKKTQIGGFTLGGGLGYAF